MHLSYNSRSLWWLIPNSKNLLKHTQNHIEESAEQVIGYKKTKKSVGWFDEECEILSEQKRKAYMAYVQHPTQQNEMEYRELRNQTKTVCRRKQRSFTNNHLRHINLNCNQYNSREALVPLKAEM